jgi:hypothetical protein
MTENPAFEADVMQLCNSRTCREKLLGKIHVVEFQQKKAKNLKTERYLNLYK